MTIDAHIKDTEKALQKATQEDLSMTPNESSPLKRKSNNDSSQQPPAKKSSLDLNTTMPDSMIDLYNQGDKAQTMRSAHLQSFQIAKATLMQSVPQIKNLLRQIQTAEQNPALLANSLQKLVHMRDSQLPHIRHQVSSLGSAPQEYFDILRTRVLKIEDSPKKKEYLDKLHAGNFWWRQFDRGKEKLLLQIQKQICDVDNALTERLNYLQFSLQTGQTPESNRLQTPLSEQSLYLLTLSSDSAIPSVNQRLVNPSDRSGNNETNSTLGLIQEVYQHASSSTDTAYAQRPYSEQFQTASSLSIQWGFDDLSYVDFVQIFR